MFGSTSTFGTPNKPTGFGFGTPTTTSNLFNATPGAFKLGFGVQQPPQQADATQQTLASFYAIGVFGDERDEILKKWNMLQACWGTGRGFYAAHAPPVEYDARNPLYRFKAISYVVAPTLDDADGCVKLLFDKCEADLHALKANILHGLDGVLGNRPNLTVHVVHVKALADAETEMMIAVGERGVAGACRKIQATDLAAYLNQPAARAQLAAAGVTAVSAYVAPSKAQLAEYLREPPAGIDAHLWRAAQLDNPAPSRYLPVPVAGFAALKRRMRGEECETGLHRGFLAKVAAEIGALRKRHAAALALIGEQKQRFLQLQHRVLKILVKQECTRKTGLVLQPEEEVLKGRLEMMSMPTQLRGKINEMLSTLKIDAHCQAKNAQTTTTTMATSAMALRSEAYKMDPDGQEELKQFLQLQQRGITHLVAIVDRDLCDLKVITEGMHQLLRN